jgi:hypothetical protein
MNTKEDSKATEPLKKVNEGKSKSYKTTEESK